MALVRRACDGSSATDGVPPYTCRAAQYLQKMQVKAAQKVETAYFAHPISMDSPEIHVVFAGRRFRRPSLHSEYLFNMMSENGNGEVADRMDVSRQLQWQ
jgi:hypothetical protein